MTIRMRMSWLVLAFLCSMVTWPAMPVAAEAKFRRCGNYQPRGGFIGEGLRADRVSCARARRVAAPYLRSNSVPGWECRQRASGRVICRRRGQGVSFGIAAEGPAG